MIYQDFCDRLQQLSKAPNMYSRLDSEHPLDIYCGYNELLQPTFMIVGTEEVDASLLHETQSISIKNILRNDAKRALLFSYTKQPYNDIFTRLCFDMLEAARIAPAKQKYSKLVHRYIAWQKMLSGTRSDILSKEQQKGLCGELLFLETFLDTIGTLPALESWRGPCQADQDFIFSNGWAEIKSIKYAADSVTISSLEQLSPDIPGILAVFKIEETSQFEQESFSLASLVDRISGKISSSPSGSLIWEDKIHLAGYDPSEKIYRNTFFVVRDKMIYSVTEGFPRLTKKILPSAVIQAKYQIDLGAIASFIQEDSNGI